MVKSLRTGGNSGGIASQHTVQALNRLQIKCCCLMGWLRQAVEFDHVLTQNTKTDLLGEANADACSILGRPVHLKQLRPGAGRWAFSRVVSMRSLSNQGQSRVQSLSLGQQPSKGLLHRASIKPAARARTQRNSVT